MSITVLEITKYFQMLLPCLEVFIYSGEVDKVMYFDKDLISQIMSFKKVKDT